MVPTYMLMGNSSSIYTDSTWHSGRQPPSKVEWLHYSLGDAELRRTSVGRVGRTHLKRVLCHTRPVGGTYDKYWQPPSRVGCMRYFLGGVRLGRTSVGHVLSVRGSGWVCSGPAGCRSRCTLTGILEHQGAFPPGFNPTRSGLVYRMIKWNMKIYSEQAEKARQQDRKNNSKRLIKNTGKRRKTKKIQR